jgi:hypothetical protein
MHLKTLDDGRRFRAGDGVSRRQSPRMKALAGVRGGPVRRIVLRARLAVWR